MRKTGRKEGDILQWMAQMVESWMEEEREDKQQHNHNNSRQSPRGRRGVYLLTEQWRASPPSSFSSRLDPYRSGGGPVAFSSLDRHQDDVPFPGHDRCHLSMVSGSCERRGEKVIQGESLQWSSTSTPVFSSAQVHLHHAHNCTPTVFEHSWHTPGVHHHISSFGLCRNYMQQPWAQSFQSPSSSCSEPSQHASSIKPAGHWRGVSAPAPNCSGQTSGPGSRAHYQAEGGW